IAHGFWMGLHEVTQEQYRTVMDANPSWFSAGKGGADKVKGLDTRNFPVESVAWQQAEEFCRRLTARPEEKRARRVYRLPWEAEWEYACRAGASSPAPFHFSRPLNTLSSTEANFDGRSPYGGAAPGRFLER